MKWKIKFNESKCNWMLADRARIVKPVFKIHNHFITQVDSLIYVCTVHTCINLLNKFERSFYSLHSLGCKPKGLNPFIISKTYKKFCQSIIFYGFETCYLSRSNLKAFNIRQKIFIKNSIGLTKFKLSSFFSHNLGP
jgi:hypothetical protein